MGEFTQNLLKLTEFPFSYSLIGLLALIFGKGINPEELSFGQLGPLLILMGFVATTLSICDPVGALQREIIKRPKLDPDSLVGGAQFLSEIIFGRRLIAHFQLPYIFAIRFTPDRIKNRNIPDLQLDREGVEVNKNLISSTAWDDELNRLENSELIATATLLVGLRDQTVKTKWITGEVDRITALIYFIVTISVFIFAILFVPYFLTKFAEPFGNIDQTKLVILILSIIALAAVIIMFLSRIYGSDGLRAKASIVFRYLTALGAIKAHKKDFDATLEDIERYLNDTHWTLAEYWVDRIQVDYSEIFLKESH